MTQTECGYTRLGYGILEQAIHDVMILQRAGLITKGELTSPWPRLANGKFRYLGWYDRKWKISQLLYWFECGAAKEMLALLNSPINIDSILTKMHDGWTEEELAERLVDERE